MNRTHPGWPAFAAAIVLVTVAGCAPGPVPRDTSGATPTPTYVQPAEPQSSLPLGCADLIGLPEVQENIPGETLAVSIDEASAPAGPEWAAFMSSGGLRCVWGGSGRTDGGYDHGLALAIIGDGATAFETWAAEVSIPVTWTIDAFGDRSMTHCDESYLNGCYGGLVVDGYWIDFSVRESVDRSVAQADGRLAALLGRVVAAVRGAGGPTPAWIPPADAFSGEAFCSDPAPIAAALGLPADAVSVQVVGADDAHQTSEGVRRAGRVSCTWGTSSTAYAASVSTIPGGAWLMKRYLADPEIPISALQGPWQPVALPGTDAAILSCGDGCMTLMIIDGSAVYLSLAETYDIAPATEQAAAFSGAGAS
jgi:hypothetical protein